MLVGEADSTAAVALAVLHTERERETADFIALHSVVDVIHVLVFLNETLAELS